MTVISVPALAIGMEDEMHIKKQTVAAPLLTHGQLQRELAYRVAMATLKDMRAAGLISGREFVRSEQFIAERFSPVWGGLYPNSG